MNRLISKKIIPNPSKSRNPEIGEIANHKRTNLEFGVVAPALETTCAATGGAPVPRWEEESDLGFVWDYCVVWLRIECLSELWLCVLECIGFSLKSWCGALLLVA